MLASCLQAGSWRFGAEGTGRKEWEGNLPGRSTAIYHFTEIAPSTANRFSQVNISYMAVLKMIKTSNHPHTGYWSSAFTHSEMVHLWDNVECMESIKNHYFYILFYGGQ